MRWSLLQVSEQEGTAACLECSATPDDLRACPRFSGFPCSQPSYASKTSRSRRQGYYNLFNDLMWQFQGFLWLLII